MTKENLELWVVWNEDGDYAAYNDREAAEESWFDEIGGFMCKIAKINLTVTIPAEVELSGEVKEGEENATLTVG